MSAARNTRMDYMTNNCATFDEASKDESEGQTDRRTDRQTQTAACEGRNGDNCNASAGLPTGQANLSPDNRREGRERHDLSHRQQELIVTASESFTSNCFKLGRERLQLELEESHGQFRLLRAV